MIEEEEEEEEEEEHEDLTIKHVHVVLKEDEKDLLKYRHSRKSSTAAKFKHPKDSKILDAPLSAFKLESYSFVDERGKISTDPADALPSQKSSSLVGGFQICLDLRHLVYNNDRLFAIVYGKKRVSTFGVSEGLTELSRTELVEVRGGLTYGATIPKCQIAFALLQVRVPDDIEYLAVSVWNADLVNSNTKYPLSSALCYRTFSVKHMHENNVFSSAMKINVEAMHSTKIHGTKADVTKSAHLGIVQIQSSLLRVAGLAMRSKMPFRPYTETMSAYRTIRGCSLCVEQIYASTFGVACSIGFLKFLINEKEPVLRVSVATSELEHESAMMRKSDSSETSRRRFSEHFGAPLYDDLIVEEHFGATEKYRKMYDEGVCDLEAILHMYINATAGVSKLDKEKNIQNVLSEDAGGGFLRRSSWKKASLWQYVTTNLNIQVLISKVLSDNEIIKNDEQAHDLQDDSLTFSLLITLGVPAAHGMKFSKGGLRRMFLEAGFVDMNARSFWLHTIQNAQLSIRDLLNIAIQRNELSLLSKLVGINKDYIDNVGEMRKNFLETAKVNPFVGPESHRFLLAKRLEICTSQILGFACALIQSVISMATLQPRSRFMDILHVSLKTGFLLPLQSLLSTQGDEQGMIEDMDAAVLFLRDVTMKVMREIRDDHKYRRKVEIKEEKTEN